MARFAKPDELKQRIQACLSELPPDEFPVHCPKCDYLLIKPRRGTCPECGLRYGRVGLLTSQYDPWRLDARKTSAGLSGRARRWHRFATALFILMLVATTGVDALYSTSRDEIGKNPNKALARFMVRSRLKSGILWSVGPVCLLTYVVSATMYSRWKRKLVLDRRRLLAKLDEIEARRSAARANESPAAASASEREPSASGTSPS